MRRTGNWSKFSVLLSVVGTLFLGASVAWAQEVPFTGIVVEDNAVLRAGAARGFYAVGSLSKGTLVTVDQVLNGWYSIAAPPGTFSYISKAYVEARGDGKSGIVTADSAWVRAAGVDKSATLSYQTHATLTKGQAVQIVGEDGDFYKIIPPPNAHVCLPPGAVRRATPAEIAAVEGGAAPAVVEPAAPAPAPAPAPAATPGAVAGAAKAETPKPAAAEKPAVKPEAAAAVPAAAPAATPGAVPAAVPGAVVTTQPAGGAAVPTVPAAVPATETPAAPAAPEAAEVTPVPLGTPVAEPVLPATQTQTTDEQRQWPTAISPQLQALEVKLKEVWDLPVEQQPAEQLIPEYKALVTDRTIPSSDRRIAQMRVYQLERNLEIANTIRRLGAADGTQRSARDVLGQFKDLPPAGSAPRYDAVGRLLASAVYDGTNLPRLYRLVEPVTGRTIAYVEPSRLADGAAYLGKVVGVVGKFNLDPSLRLNIIEVEKVTVLAPVKE
ncbi:MAG: hypothetical protein IT443_09805 [Phycisphaeraceae bacterium]|nr:hypothetical protein [Phycisphaeraceae bacterium]